MLVVFITWIQTTRSATTTTKTTENEWQHKTKRNEKKRKIFAPSSQKKRKINKKIVFSAATAAERRKIEKYNLYLVNCFVRTKWRENNVIKSIRRKAKHRTHCLDLGAGNVSSS